MHSLSRRLGAALVAVVALLTRSASSTPGPLSVTPSSKWYGDDGSWSAISIRLGTPQQWLDVMVSTVSSETWVVENYGCPVDKETSCPSIRGGIFTLNASTSWNTLGFYSFGVDSQLGNSGYAEYGLDILEFGSTNISLPKALIGSFNESGTVNTTQNLLGSFGLGIVPGNFNNATQLGPISALMEAEGAIPSHSYGYTAGAKYQLKGTPNSLTLGGYDANRFIPNDVSFTLNLDNNPEVYINSISVTNANGSVELVQSADRVSAIIDSSTPYLWLPQAACDRFAAQLGLVYNNSLNLYTYSNTSQHDLLQTSSPTFSFSLSDTSVSPALVNIALPFDAFDLELIFPAIPGTKDGDANATMLYFPLRQAATNAQYTIGRVFLQEAYIITDYERNNFSLHQAVHTASPLVNTSLIPITQPLTTKLSGPPITSSGGMKLSTPAIVGISVAAFVFTVLVTFAVLYCYRRKHKKESGDDEKPALPFTFLGRMRRRRHTVAHETAGDSSFPMEVGAGPENERFELDAPLGPVELDSESGTLEGSTQRGSSIEDSNNISAYERARRKLERQQIAAAQAQRAMDYPVEKSENDVSPIETYRRLEIPDLDSPLISPVGAGSAGSLTLGHQDRSPVSPGFLSTPVSPITAGPPPTYQRINPANVVYAGRLPDNVQLPQVIPTFVGSGGRVITHGGTAITDPSSSLGSQYTEHESDLYGSNGTRASGPPSSPSAYGSGGTNGLPSNMSDESRRMHTLRSDAGIQELLDPHESRRRLNGEDIVHVPQPAENRFSWEEERERGTS